MIELKNVCYAYGNEIALRYINLNIQKGESVIIQGPNGCGKSTLIKILNGIIFPMEGSYTYEDHEITEKALEYHEKSKKKKPDHPAVLFNEAYFAGKGM